MRGANLLITIPHSGERIPRETPWLHALPPEVLLLDIDRFVDRLYAPAIGRLKIVSVTTDTHRYAVDLNRAPADVDSSTVVGAPLPPGTHPKGFHWAVSTQGHPILTSPISKELHELLVLRYHDPFHERVARALSEMDPAREIYHLDCHSMPSRGTRAHADEGARRPDVVLSDFDGRSARPEFLAVLKAAFESEGLQVSVNWPYKGGKITQRYGQPRTGHHTLQIELNRALYMDESTREPLFPDFGRLQEVLSRVIQKAHDFSAAPHPASG
jgi:N-formylglutamate deformylase